MIGGNGPITALVNPVTNATVNGSSILNNSSTFKKQANLQHFE
jgi:hypothetical protein